VALRPLFRGPRVRDSLQTPRSTSVSRAMKHDPKASRRLQRREGASPYSPKASRKPQNDAATLVRASGLDVVRACRMSDNDVA